MATIQGRVVDYDNDAPIKDVQVLGIAENGVQFASTTSNSEGKFTIDSLGFDDLYSRIRFVKSGYATQEMRPASANNADVVLPKQGTMSTFTVSFKQQNPVTVLLIVALVIVAAYFIFKNVKI